MQGDGRRERDREASSELPLVDVRGIGSWFTRAREHVRFNVQRAAAFPSAGGTLHRRSPGIGEDKFRRRRRRAGGIGTEGRPRARSGRKARQHEALVTEATLEIETLIRQIPDFPIPGILFRDITPLLKDKGGFAAAVDLFVQRYRGEHIDVVVGVEARGYMFAAPLAYAIGAGFVPVRKPGKLPGAKYVESYALEYGTNSLEIHDDAVGHGQRVVIVDDLLATGGTAAATGRLLSKLGAVLVGYAFLIELTALGGRAALGDHDVTAFLRY